MSIINYVGCGLLERNSQNGANPLFAGHSAEVIWFSEIALTDLRV